MGARMNSFALHNLPASNLRVVNHNLTENEFGWDEMDVVIEGLMSVEEMRGRYQSGMGKSGQEFGLGFYAQTVECEAAGAGFSRAHLTMKGLTRKKLWSEPGVALATRQMENLTVKVGGVNKTYDKASVLDATPTLTVNIWDAGLPPYDKVGKTAAALALPGIVFPVDTDGGWTFWGSYVPTHNVPFGWVLTDVSAEPVTAARTAQGTDAMLWGKRLTFTKFWEQVP